MPRVFDSNQRFVVPATTAASAAVSKRDGLGAGAVGASARRRRTKASSSTKATQEPRQFGAVRLLDVLRERDLKICHRGRLFFKAGVK